MILVSYDSVRENPEVPQKRCPVSRGGSQLETVAANSAGGRRSLGRIIERHRYILIFHLFSN